ncbi:MAG: hypothetical protein L6W00_26425 [Lentisphaeria bacterium]|nr:MAG: hypothetical protein L6W00_26425 [Lentisphaeria bacterium]
MNAEKRVGDRGGGNRSDDGERRLLGGDESAFCVAQRQLQRVISGTRCGGEEELPPEGLPRGKAKLFEKADRFRPGGVPDLAPQREWLTVGGNRKVGDTEFEVSTASPDRRVRSRPVRR